MPTRPGTPFPVARARNIDQPPEGLVLEPEFLTEDEERALLSEIERLDFHEIRMHGVAARRTARHFGVDYDYERRGITRRVDPIPEWLLPTRAAGAVFAALPPDELVE